MELKQVISDKKRLLPLLLLGDEQESMIDRYLERGQLYVLSEGTTIYGVIVITQEEENLFEIKNMAVQPAFQRQGYGREMIDRVRMLYKDKGKNLTLQVGTGETPSTLNFYQACGFSISHRVKDFFLQYDHPIYEDGTRLQDMIYLQMSLHDDV